MIIKDFKKAGICFEPAQIEDSGQCFRFVHRQAPLLNTGDILENYTTISKGRFLEISLLKDDRVAFSCTEEDFKAYWHDYFDLDTDYEAIKASIDPKDTFLTNAAAYGSGIRILKQDIWEMMVSFIISQRKSIPAIRSCIESLCKSYGTPMDIKGETFYSFPEPEALANLSLDDLKPHGVGYRDKYILTLARQVSSGEIDPESYSKLPADEAVNELTKLFGVGVKVANCISLFGLHNIDAFPEDVWIKRVIAKEYKGSFNKERYAGFAGVIQQYMFFYGKSNLKY